MTRYEIKVHLHLKVSNLSVTDFFQVSDGEVEGVGGREGEGRGHRVPGEALGWFGFWGSGFTALLPEQ